MKVSVFLNCEGERRKVGMLDDEMGIRFQYTDDFVELCWVGSQGMVARVGETIWR